MQYEGVALVTNGNITITKSLFIVYRYPTMEVKDTNGNLLQAGDSVVISQDIPVKGSKPIKR
ncbi:MAG: PhnA domain-containing protein [bacterium]